MDFGVVVGLDVLGDSAFAASSDPESNNKLNNKRYGSAFLKQEIPGLSTVGEEDAWGSSKMAKTALDSNSNTMLRSNATPLYSSEGHQQAQMLSFSCPKSEQQNAILPSYCHYPFSADNRSNSSHRAGYNTRVGGSMHGHGVLTGVRGPFTPSQWMELEHQALIYKYITANVPIPSNLLIPIRKALDSAAFSAALLRPNTLGWGSFHLGFSGNTDPEPGRCRRTDGKKWRCSRDAVADQKYCERHMNRGRHRSRKPVEGQAAATNSMAKLMPAVSSSSASAVASGSLAVAQQQQLKNLQSPASNNRMYMNKEDACDPKSKDNPFMFPKQQNPFEETSRTEFGLVPSDSLLNPSNKSSTLMNYKSFSSSHDRDSEAQHSLRQFMDDWPKNNSDRAAVSWPELDMQSDRTQLSISIPVAPTNNEKVTLSPLRLSREFDPIQMGLGVGSALNETRNRQANWIPISWETSMGGPLGEVLHNTNNNSTMNCKSSSSALNLMTEGWDNSPRLGSSPTGVLQKTAFGSLSNSSAGSSPRAHEGASLCNDLLGTTTLVNSSLSERY